MDRTLNFGEFHIMGRRIWAGASAALLVAAVLAVQANPVASRTAAPAGVDEDVRINEIQVIGSHNSYKRMVSPDEEALRRTFIGDGADLMAYQHEPLGVQFQSQKVRQIELDVFRDDAGGLYSDPLLRSAAGVGPYDPAMNQPGTKVLHIQDVDYASTCLSLIDCVQDIETWSDANPSHMPIAVLLEFKDDPLSFGDLVFTTPEPWTGAAMQAVDAEIRSIMNPADLITPDDVRGSYSTLDEAVTTGGWPTLGESRGKVMFMMDNGGGYRTGYLSGNPTLEGRVLFTNASPGQPDAAFVKRNDAFDASIPGLVADGYVVRTRADSDTTEARANDTAKRDAALASGAQWVSTDYPVPGIAFGFTTEYVAEIPGGTVGRCNPINGPATCVSSEIDPIGDPEPPPTTTIPPTTVPPTTVATTTPTATQPRASAAVPVSGSVSYTG